MSAYASLVLSLSPSAYWRFGEASGSSIADSAGTNTGTLAGVTTLGQTSLLVADGGTACLFGAAGLMTAPSAAALNLGDGPFTILFWTRRGASMAATQVVFDKGATGGDGYGGYFTNTDTFRWTDSSGGGSIIDTTAIKDQSPHMLAWGKNAAANTSYLDGASNGTAGSNVTLSNTTNVLHIASDAGGATGYPGTVEEFAMFQLLLTPAQIGTIYEAGMGWRYEPTIMRLRNPMNIH